MNQLKMLMVGILTFGMLMAFHHPVQAHESACNTPVKVVLKAFKEEIRALGKARISNGILYFGNVAANANFGLVNAVTNKTGYVASIYIASPPGTAPLTSQFIRVVTNLTSGIANATGTILDPTGAPYKAVSNGKNFFGVVNLFGNEYNSGYSPIRDKDGNILGALFVGKPKTGIQ